MINEISDEPSEEYIKEIDDLFKEEIKLQMDKECYDFFEKTF